MNKIALISNIPLHYGSTVVGPIASSVNGGNFVNINSSPIMDKSNTIDTPSHQYASLPDLFHSHGGQIIDVLQNSYVYIEGNEIIVEGDKNGGNDTRIVDAGQSFVSIT